MAENIDNVIRWLRRLQHRKSEDWAIHMHRFDDNLWDVASRDDHIRIPAHLGVLAHMLNELNAGTGAPEKALSRLYALCLRGLVVRHVPRATGACLFQTYTTEMYSVVASRLQGLGVQPDPQILEEGLSDVL